MKTQTLKNKSQAAFSTLCWGFYMILNGLSMIIFPNATLAAMGFELTTEILIRMLGLLSLVLGFYYIQMGRYYFAPFYSWKIMGHISGILIMTFFYLQGLAPATIFMICLSDAMAAAWTAWGISQDRKKALQATLV
ncbi:hypothetical protein [Catalinimonas niigatensis]|uniref:hypothetical protein n=1 Tax=Catalinimonas niigatensis TaxID=1397264 RepID=UPI0026651E5F|nr:hypothetical protein [Catalinimonas niigatensis]WPP49342.1 hypothetical protein PZB72_21980 [Catalinimonas niigatensis]